MKIPRGLHSWSVTPKQAIAIQRRLASRIIRTGRSLTSAVRIGGSAEKLRLVAGADLAFSRNGDECIAGVVVWDVRAGEVVEQHVVRKAVRFPYVPGLLSFREAPAIIAVLRKLKSEPYAFIFDGQGLAHPRRFGLACHVGLLIDRPSLGCAKSVLVGTSETPGLSRGSSASLEHNGERIGLALRTRERVRPVYVSIGHRLSLDLAARITLACYAGYRLPEPTRLADKLVAREKARV